ncbi:MAG: thioredoxin domain-containing protein [Anaerolineae bacterium]
MANRLAQALSPYLLQHADNPVDWYPWGEEALARARAEDKPIFLSIGYSACHWCHVMAHESFEDPGIAELLNESFISIKVDREERPDLDRVYMDAVQAMAGQGGWPMSVFLTPDGKPFHAGTYFPPEPRHGLPSFRQVLAAVRDAWQDRRAEVERGGAQVVEHLALTAQAPARGARPTLDATVLHQAAAELVQAFDSEAGGWGAGPKFPQPMVLEFLLRQHHTTGDTKAIALVTQTLEAMARGGIYDQVGGGFHRYAVDGHWLVPHFEKMLYDNAQLARVYLHAWQVTGEALYLAIAEETLDYVAREMTGPEGGFYASQDADSEGEEGRYYLWTGKEVEEVLGDEAAAFATAFGVTPSGNLEGRNILTYQGAAAGRPAYAKARQALLAAREGRVHPGRDTKVLTSWNGLMLAAFAEAARVLGREDYGRIAERSGGFLLNQLRNSEGCLLHVWKEGQARLNGYLEDYAYLIDGLLELYQTTFADVWYAAARDLADQVVMRFGAEDGFYDTSDDHENLIVRPRELQDNAVPSGGSLAALGLLRLADLSQEPHYADWAWRGLRSVGPHLGRHPLGFGQWLNALHYAVSPRREVAIAGDPSESATQGLIQTAQMGYNPSRTVVAGEPPSNGEGVPLLRDRSRIEGHPAAYVCEPWGCRPPVTDADALQRILREPVGHSA